LIPAAARARRSCSAQHKISIGVTSFGNDFAMEIGLPEWIVLTATLTN
jgi:hypothetical protein